MPGACLPHMPQQDRYLVPETGCGWALLLGLLGKEAAGDVRLISSPSMSFQRLRFSCSCSTSERIEGKSSDST